MSHYSVIRSVDMSERINVPYAFREMLGIRFNDPVEIYIVGNDLVIRKIEKKADPQAPKEDTTE